MWPEGTLVDYEDGLNAPVTRLRQVMGDSAESPRYVETLGRKGCRFIAPVERIPAPDRAQAAREGIYDRTFGQPQTTVLEPQELANQPRLLRLWPFIAVLAIGITAGGATVWWRDRLS